MKRLTFFSLLISFGSLWGRPVAAEPAVSAAQQWRQKAAALPAPKPNSTVLAAEWVRGQADPVTPLKPGAAIKEGGWKHVDLQSALEVLAEEARDMNVKKAANVVRRDLEHRHAEGAVINDDNLRMAFEVLTFSPVLNRCSEEQTHLAAALAIELLDDSYVLFDWSDRAGAIIQARNLAAKVLESLAGRSNGDLILEGGPKAPGWYHDAKIEEDATIKAWQTWWANAADRPRVEWTKL